MTSIAFPLAALLTFQGATPSPARECEPADNRCKAALFERRAAAAASPKARALYLHGAHRSYLALFDQTGQEKHLCAARKTYEHRALVWGARHADVLSERPDGDLVVDVSRFHDLVAVEASEHFPYAWKGSTPAA